MSKNIVELIYREYYQTIFRYCRVRLNGDIQGAEDCTQEVFLALHRKIKNLVELDSILPWLYRAADKEISAYRRKHPETIDIEEIPEPIEQQMDNSPLDSLEDEDRHIIEQYYLGADKAELAGKLGISLDALYKRVRRIRIRLQEYLDSLHK